MNKYSIIGLILSILVFAGALKAVEEMKILNKTIDTLKLEVSNLERKNSNLLTKQSDIFEKIEAKKSELISKNLKEAKYKLSKAEEAMVPFQGAPKVAKYTELEVKSLCTQVQEFKLFESTITGQLDEVVGEKEAMLCNINTGTSLNSDMLRYSRASDDWLKHHYKTKTLFNLMNWSFMAIKEKKL